MTELYTDEYFRVFIDKEVGIVRVVRSALRYPDAESIEHSFSSMAIPLLGINPSQYGLLVDTRAATGRNDVDFEEVSARHRNRLLDAFAVVAMVVETSVGKMQVERLSREHGGVKTGAFMSEEEAVAFLLAERG